MLDILEVLKEASGVGMAEGGTVRGDEFGKGVGSQTLKGI